MFTTLTDPELQPILDELILREPIFHTPACGITLADFDRLMSSDYCEIGASGRTYTRALILQHLAQNPPMDAATAGWQTSDHALRALSSNTYLFTYNLLQGKRLTRRATLWQHIPTGWQILYHQGTLVTENNDTA
jgi:hypothetical protein